MSERHIPDDRLAEYARQGSVLRGAPLIAIPGRSRPLPWDGWTRRHAVAMAVLVPVLFLGFRGATPVSGRDTPLGIVATLVLAGLGAIVLATYVPRRTARPTTSDASTSDQAPAGAASGLPATAGATPCATMAGGSVVVAMIVLSTSTAVVGVIAALAVMAFGLYQRTSGHCGVPS